MRQTYRSFRRPVASRARGGARVRGCASCVAATRRRHRTFPPGGREIPQRRRQGKREGWRNSQWPGHGARPPVPAAKSARAPPPAGRLRRQQQRIAQSQEGPVHPLRPGQDHGGAQRDRPGRSRPRNRSRATRATPRLYRVRRRPPNAGPAVRAQPEPSSVLPITRDARRQRPPSESRKSERRDKSTRAQRNETRSD